MSHCVPCIAVDLISDEISVLRQAPPIDMQILYSHIPEWARAHCCLLPDQQRSGVCILSGEKRTVSDLKISHHVERECSVRFQHWSGGWTSLVSP